MVLLPRLPSFFPSIPGTISAGTACRPSSSEERLDQLYDHAVRLGISQPQAYAERLFAKGSSVCFIDSKPPLGFSESDSGLDSVWIEIREEFCGWLHDDLMLKLRRNVSQFWKETAHKNDLERLRGLESEPGEYVRVRRNKVQVNLANLPYDNLPADLKVVFEPSADFLLGRLRHAIAGRSDIGNSFVRENAEGFFDLYWKGACSLVIKPLPSSKTYRQLSVEGRRHVREMIEVAIMTASSHRATRPWLDYSANRRMEPVGASEETVPHLVAILEDPGQPVDRILYALDRLEMGVFPIDQDLYDEEIWALFDAIVERISLKDLKRVAHHCAKSKELEHYLIPIAPLMPEGSALKKAADRWDLFGDSLTDEDVKDFLEELEKSQAE